MSARNFNLIDRLDNLTYQMLFSFWAIIVISFAFTYVILTYIPQSAPVALVGLPFFYKVANALYFSVITATNTGYGDIVPIGLSRFFAAAEAFSGLFLFALFISKLVSRRESIAIAHMHRISFEGTFHNIREDLHTVRMDFDKIMRVVLEKKQLQAEEWHLLIIAAQQIENLISEVPNFYDEETHLYRIDARREVLLIEAFHRTLERLDRFLTACDEHQIFWRHQKRFYVQLRQLVVVVGSVSRRWQIDAGEHKVKQFELITDILLRIESTMNSTKTV